MPRLLFYSNIDPIEQWRPALEAEMPELEIRVYPEIGAMEEIDYALVWQPPHGLLASLPNLRLIHTVGAGVDALFLDPDLPTHVPIVRMVDRCLRNMMSEYALYAVLHHHRDMPHYGAQQGRGDWTRHWPDMTPETPVGILGLGEIGRDVAAKFATLGFPVHGWSRSRKELPGVTCHAGADGLTKLLATCRYVVCILPLTDETRGLVDEDFLRAMRKDAVLINIGRGAHVVDDDLLAALDTGEIAGAVLDVFNEEPLPADHPYWHHPKVIATPHIAAETDPKDGAVEVVANLRRFEAGEPLPTLVTPKAGY